MIKASTQMKSFQIDSATITFRVNHSPLFDFIAQWLYHFAPNTDHEPVQESTIHVHFRHYESGEPLPFQIPNEARQTHQNESATYYSYRNLWIVAFPDSGLMIINRATRKILGFVYSQFILASLWDFEVFMHPLYELLRQQGIYTHHAAAVSYDGFGLLLAGKSGQGKSTLSVDLLDKGFSFLADDRCFLVDHADHIEVLGFYEPAKLFASNVSHIEKLHPQTAGFKTKEKKEPLDVRHYYPTQVERTSQLNAIVFPQWSPNEKSRIEFLPTGKAMVELIPLTLVCLDAMTCKTHFQFTANLVKRLPAIRFILGGDRENWHMLLISFISDLRRSDLEQTEH